MRQGVSRGLLKPAAATSATATTPVSGTSSTKLSVEQLKRQILQLAALTDRGKLQDPLVSEEGLYR